MIFTCHPDKNATNISERGLPLLAARVMFTGDLLVREDVRKPYPEKRYVGYGKVDGRLMVVVFCLPAPEHIHIISFRKGNKREQAFFDQQSH